MTQLTTFSRREREIMEIVYSLPSVNVHEICNRLDGQPTPMAVRRMLAILMEKGQLKRVKQGREFLYSAKHSRSRAGVRALRKVIDTFFDGSVGTALATHFERPGSNLSGDDVQRLSELIEQLKREQEND